MTVGKWWLLVLIIYGTAEPQNAVIVEEKQVGNRCFAKGVKTVIDTQRFEGLLEALDNEIEDLPSGSVKENLTDISSALYGIFEDISLVDVDKVTEENEVLKQLLTAYLSHEDKQYIKIKYDIDF